MGFDHFSLLFLQSSISALVTASAAWVLLHLARGRWPGLDARRSPWLLAQLIPFATLILALLPAASRWSLFASAPAAQDAGKWHVLGTDAMVVLQETAGAQAAPELLPALAWCWAVVYLAGAAWHALRWLRAGRGLRTLLFVAERLDDAALAAHPAFARQRAALPPVLEVDAPVSPMLAGLFAPVLLLPRHMRELPPLQQQLIVAHELAHLRRRDPLSQHGATLAAVLLWFIPAVHSLRGRLQWALELGCDRAVLAGRPQDERRSYAAALLAQLAMQVRAGSRLTPDMAPASLAFGVRGAQAVAERIRLIRDAQPAAHGRFAGMAAVLLLPALCGASVLLQPQFAWRDAGADNAALALQAPLAQLRVTGSYGSINHPGGQPHRGTDFGAARGTVVLAPADGKVAISTDRYEGGARYGKVLVIEHAGGTRTLYAHLDQRLVQAGERVRAGQHIALSGATGKVTGPHLHFEVSQQGTHVDPQALLKGAR
jgi:murein DD-endopeptidase MepM/ murein hydrolase activator NlpD